MQKSIACGILFCQSAASEARLRLSRNHMEPCMSQNWPVGIQAMLMCAFTWVAG